MEAYLRVFINYEKNNWVRLLLIAKFAYNNTKYASIGYMPFDLNCGYHSHIFYEEIINLSSISKAADELTEEFQNLITAYRKNLQYAQK